MALTRWTEKDLKKIATKLSPAKNIADSVLPAQSTGAPLEKKKTTTVDRRNSVITSITHAKVTGSYKKDQFIEFFFDGAQLLSVNSLYALNPFQRTAYKKAWHNAIAWAAIEITGGPRNFQPFERFTIEAQIQTRRRCDTDAPQGQLKYALDGLTKAKIIVDDNPKCFLGFDCKPQLVGKPFVYLRITAENDAK